PAFAFADAIIGYFSEGVETRRAQPMLLAFWEDGGWQDAAIVAAIILIAYALVMWVGALVWTYRDMQARSRDPFTQIIAVILVLVFNLPGIMLYMVLRPKETLAELYDRQ